MNSKSPAAGKEKINFTSDRSRTDENRYPTIENVFTIYKKNIPEDTETFPGHTDKKALVSTDKKYTGNKNIPGLIQKIINNIPKHTIMYEMFAGSAAVSKIVSVGSLAQYFAVELDPEVIKQIPPHITAYEDSALLRLTRMIVGQNTSKQMNFTHEFIFLDPPYLHSTRSDSKLYKHELTEREHKNLLVLLKIIRSRVMIIHPDCELYNTMLSDWRKVQVKIRYNNKTSIENLYMNYSADVELHTTKFLGADCWDRQRIKRKGDNLISKLNRLSPNERKYLLERIKQEIK